MYQLTNYIIIHLKSRHYRDKYFQERYLKQLIENESNEKMYYLIILKKLSSKSINLILQTRT